MQTAGSVNVWSETVSTAISGDKAFAPLGRRATLMVASIAVLYHKAPPDDS